jgi:hypothetical protein
MASELPAALAEVLRHAADRPLGDIKLKSNVNERRFEQVPYRAADNLLDKAQRAIESGDRERARGYVERATRLPFDEHEQQHPGLNTAHMLLFSTVTDALEECEPSDSSWLDAALQVLPSCGEDARQDLLETLRTAAQDWGISAKEARRVREITAGVDPVDVLERRVDDDQLTQQRVILELLDAVIAYNETFDQLHDRP